MKKTVKFAAMAAVVVMAMNSSAFADQRHRNETDGRWRADARDDSRRTITMEGRVRSVDRDRDGFRVQLDRGNYSYYVPQSALRSRHNDLRVGVSLRFTGFLRDDYVYVDSCDFLGSDGYNDYNDYNDGYYDNRGRDRYGYDDYDHDHVRGVVERVDYYRGTMLLREERSGRRITVYMPRRSRNRRGIDLNDLQRGDVVSLSGEWRQRGAFEAFAIDSVRDHRW